MASRLFSVITGFIPVILVQQVSYLVNKFALLLHKYRFGQDCRNQSGNDGCWGRWLNICCQFFKRMYHPGSSANELTLKAKDDESGGLLMCWGRRLNVCCKFFNTTTFNVILRRERSELSGESRNIMAIFLNAANSIVSSFFTVITGFIPVILVQRVTNQVNKFALLLHKYRFSQDCRNTSGNDCAGVVSIVFFTSFLSGCTILDPLRMSQRSKQRMTSQGFC